MTAVCVFEAKMALFTAAGRATSAYWARDVDAHEFWRGQADVARAWLRRAVDERDAREQVA